MTQGTLNRRYYKSIGYCPRCNGSNKLMPGENNCPECAAKEYAYSLKRNKKHYNEVHARWSKTTYQKRKELGLCTRCGKHPPKEGQLRCVFCINKDSKARYKREIHLSRYERGICRWCDRPIEDGYKVCEYHHQMNIQKGQKK